MRIFLIVSILFISMNSKIIEVKQLFNKSLVQVKQINYSKQKTFYAKTTYDETKIRDVVLRFSGFIKDLKANSTHKYIKKGDKLFSIYSKEASITLDELVMAVQYKSARGLIKNIQERLELLDISKKTINQTKKNKKIPYYIDIVSKYEGVVINKKINEQSYAKEGKTLFQIADLRTIWVDAQVYQKDLNFVRESKTAKVFIDNLGVFDANIALIHPIVDNKTKTIPVRLIIDNKDLKIYPNMFATVSFKQNKKSMLVLPKSAVITKGLTHYIFKPISKKEFEPIKVEAKRINSKQFEIISGLKKGDSVINNALFMLDSDAVTNGLYDEDDDDW